MNKKITLAFPLFLALLATNIVSCGPMYSTDYSFVPPKTESGRACTYNCQTTKSQCRQIEDLRVDRCEAQAREDARECEARIRWDKGRSPKWYECGGSSCSADYDQCEDQYRSCYQSCGGRVESSTRCVANCDQIADKSGAKAPRKGAKSGAKSSVKSDTGY